MENKKWEMKMENAGVRRNRFQVHLSTAIALMFVAGGLLWANVSGRTEVVLRSNLDGTQSARCAFKIRGWPFEASRHFTGIEGYTSETGERVLGDEDRIDYWSAGLDALVAVAILTGVWLALESRIRYGAGGKMPMKEDARKNVFL